MVLRCSNCGWLGRRWRAEAELKPAVEDSDSRGRAQNGPGRASGAVEGVSLSTPAWRPAWDRRRMPAPALPPLLLDAFSPRGPPPGGWRQAPGPQHGPPAAATQARREPPCAAAWGNLYLTLPFLGYSVPRYQRYMLLRRQCSEGSAIRSQPPAAGFYVSACSAMQACSKHAASLKKPTTWPAGSARGRAQHAAADTCKGTATAPAPGLPSPHPSPGQARGVRDHMRCAITGCSACCCALQAFLEPACTLIAVAPGSASMTLQPPASSMPD